MRLEETSGMIFQTLVAILSLGLAVMSMVLMGRWI
jgi:hypothetical protein